MLTKQNLLLPTMILASACLANATPTIVTNGTSLTLGFDGSGGSPVQTITGLTANLQLTAFNFLSYNSGTHSGQTAVSFNYSMFNNSTAPMVTSRVSGFGFNTTPNIVNTVDNIVTGVYNGIVYSVNFPNGIGTVELCITAQSCPGGGGGGVNQGNTGTGSATLYFSGLINSLTIDAAYDRYQSLTCTTGVLCPGSATGNVTTLQTGGNVPEPNTVGLIGLGLIFLAFLPLRKKA